LLKRLEQSGLIRRERRQENEREVRIMLTDSGHALRDKAKSVPLALKDAMGLEIEELTELRTRLDHLLAQAKAPA